MTTGKKSTRTRPLSGVLFFKLKNMDSSTVTCNLCNEYSSPVGGFVFFIMQERYLNISEAKKACSSPVGGFVF